MIAVDWGSLEETFVVWRAEGSCTLREFQSAFMLSSRMINSKDYPVDLIADVRTATVTPALLQTILKIYHKNPPGNLGKAIILYHTDYWQRVFRLLENFYPKLFRELIFTASVDEAYLLVLPAA